MQEQRQREEAEAARRRHEEEEAAWKRKCVYADTTLANIVCVVFFCRFVG